MNNVRELIYHRYARILGNGAPGPTAIIYQKLRDGRLRWQDLADTMPDEPLECAWCGERKNLSREPVVPRCIRVKESCEGCPNLRELWTCTDCLSAMGTLGVYAYHRRRFPNDARWFDRVPRAVEAAYLRTIFECHDCAGTLDARDLDGDGRLTVGDLDEIVARYAQGV